MEPPHTGERMTGTTIMAVEFDGGVVLAADSRTSTGAYIANRTSDKLTPVHERIYTCRSGSAADTQAMSDYVRLYLSHYVADTAKEPTVGIAAHLFKSISYQNKNRLTAGIICAGGLPSPLAPPQLSSRHISPPEAARSFRSFCSARLGPSR
jgi:20S proteasome subunit beta 1